MTGAILITLGLILRRMECAPKPYISPKVFTKFRYVKAIFLLIVLYEAILGTEHVLEDLFKEHILGYNMLTNAQPTWAVWAGNIAGCLFSLAVDEACATFHLYSARNSRHLCAVFLCVADVPSHHAHAQYRGVVSAAFLPRICLRLA